MLIAVGVLMFGFVGYQLWGTGIETELAQQRLREDFADLLAASENAPRSDVTERRDQSTTPTSTTPPSATGPGAGDEAESTSAAATAVPIAQQPLPELANGTALARLEVPAIGIDDIVVAGIGVSDLKLGPGHFPDTPLPGQLGNAAIAGHRTTYGAPFFDVDQLQEGDEMIVTTLAGRYVYEVDSQRIVDPSAYEVIATSDPSTATLTLVSCEPKWTARNRIVITGVLDDARSAPVGEPLLNYGRTAESSDGPQPSDTASSGVDGLADAAVDTDLAGPSDDAATESVSDSTETPSVRSATGLDQPSSELADAFGQGWFSDPGANRHVGLWGLMLASIATAAWWLSRRVGRNLVGAAVGVAPFVVSLYFFYQNVNRLLPPGL